MKDFIKNWKKRMREHEYEYEQVYSSYWVKAIVQSLIMILSVVFLALIVLNVSKFIIPKGAWINIVNGHSMDPNLHHNQIVYSDMSEYTTGDIVVTYVPARGIEQYPEKANLLIIKRVIGVPGDRLIIDESGNVFINGEIYTESYLSEAAKSKTYISGLCNSVLLKEGEYFIMGDNRGNSYDSRYFGVVTRSDILYKQVTTPNENFWTRLVLVIIYFAIAYIMYMLVDFILTECSFAIVKAYKKKNGTYNEPEKEEDVPFITTDTVVIDAETIKNNHNNTK